MNIEQEQLTSLRKVQLEILDEFVSICEENNLSYFLTAGTLLGAVRHKGFIPWDDDVDVAMPRKDYELLLDIYDKKINESYYVVSYRTKTKAGNYCKHFSRFCKSCTLYAEKNKEPDGYTGIFIDIWPFDKSILFFASLQYNLIKLFLKLCRIKAGINLYYSKWKYSLGKFFCLFLSVNFLNNIHRKLYLIFNKNKTKYITFFSALYGAKRETHKYNIIYPLDKILFEEKYYNVPNNYDRFLKDLYGNYMILPPVENQRIHSTGEIIFNTDKQ